MLPPAGIIALDLARFTGFAQWRPGMDRPEFAQWQLRKGDGPGAGATLSDLRARLEPRLKSEPPRALYFEAPFVPRASYNKKTKVFIDAKTTPATVRKLHGYPAVVEMLCDQYGIPVYEAHSGEHRRHFMGVGGGKRDEIKRRIVERCLNLGIPVDNDDEAEAISILFLGLHELKMNPPFNVSPYDGPLLSGKDAA